MDDKVLARGAEIFRLIPQRPPMMMVDTLFSADENGGETGLTVLEDNVFCIDGHLLEPGIIEHSAQSAAAFAGYRYFLAGEEPHIGLIGEIKAFRISRRPAAGENLRTRVTVTGGGDGGCRWSIRKHFPAARCLPMEISRSSLSISKSRPRGEGFREGGNVGRKRSASACVLQQRETSRTELNFSK